MSSEAQEEDMRAGELWSQWHLTPHHNFPTLYRYQDKKDFVVVIGKGFGGY